MKRKDFFPFRWIDRVNNIRIQLRCIWSPLIFVDPANFRTLFICFYLSLSLYIYIHMCVLT